MKVTFSIGRAHFYSEVWKITEYRNGAVYKTQHLGYCHDSRPKKEGEIYGSLSTSLFFNKEGEPVEEITLDLLED